MALDPLYFAVADSIPHGLGFDQGECAKLTVAKNTMLNILVCGWRKWGHAILGASVKRSDTGQGKSEEWGEGVEIDTHVLRMVESSFSATLRRTSSLE